VVNEEGSSLNFVSLYTGPRYPITRWHSIPMSAAQQCSQLQQPSTRAKWNGEWPLTSLYCTLHSTGNL